MESHQLWANVTLRMCSTSTDALLVNFWHLKRIWKDKRANLIVQGISDEEESLI